jgi:hypothetical protein
MRALLGRVAANAGASLTVGGTVLAIGVALGAVGLGELRPDTPPSPFSNGFVRAGMVLIALGAVWTIGTFVLAMVATAKTEYFRDEIADALRAGNVLMESQTEDADEAERWGQTVADLIEAGLGGFEAVLFVTDQDLGINLRPTNQSDVQAWLRRRIQRLARLLDRAQALQVSPASRFVRRGFQEWLSSSPAISSKDQT